MQKFIPDHIQSLTKAKDILLSLVLLMTILSCKEAVYEQPQQRNVREVVFASGHIETEEQYLITSAVDGYIEKSFVKEGMVVDNDALLAEISKDTPKAQLDDALAAYQEAKKDVVPDSPKIREVELKIDLAKKELSQNEKVLQSYEKLVKINAVSKIDLENQQLKTQNSRKDLKVLEDSKKDLLESLNLNLQNANNLVKIRTDDLNKYQLRSSGQSQVLKSYLKEGEFIRRGEPFAEMGKGIPIVKLFIGEGDINSVNLGQRVELSVNTYKGTLFQGEVFKIYPAFDEAQQSFIIEVKFTNTPKRLFPGTQVQANILILEKESVLVIPTRSLISKNQVMLKDKGVVELQLGVQHDDWVEVLSGISKDDFIQVKTEE